MDHEDPSSSSSLSSSSSSGYQGGISVTLPVAMTIAGFFAVSIYAVLDINIQIFFIFKKYAGLYFWSLLFASWGIVVHSVGFLLKFFQICENNYANITIITLGGVPMVIGQSVVLYSRLDLVTGGKTGRGRGSRNRWVLAMIGASFLLFTVPPTVLNYGANSEKPGPFLPVFKAWERVAMVGFCCVEFVISGLYVWRTRKILVAVRMSPGSHGRAATVMRHLILVNLLVVLMDFTLLALIFVDLYYIETTYKGALYATKLKLEFPVLNDLRKLVKKQRCTCGETDMLASYVARSGGTGEVARGDRSEVSRGTGTTITSRRNNGHNLGSPEAVTGFQLTSSPSRTSIATLLVITVPNIAIRGAHVVEPAVVVPPRAPSTSQVQLDVPRNKQQLFRLAPQNPAFYLFGRLRIQRNSDSLNPSTTKMPSLPRKDYCHLYDITILDQIIHPFTFSIILTPVKNLLECRRVALHDACEGTEETHSSRDVGWYGSAYQLTGCAVQLPLARFYSFFPPKHVYVALMLVFLAGSSVGAGARTSAAVVAGRAVQGLGLGGVLSGSTILVAETLPLRKRPVAMGVLMACLSVGSVVGPLIGGALTGVSWRWCFIVNLPVGAAVVATLVFLAEATPRTGQNDETRNWRWRDKARRLDPLGAALLVPAVVCVVLALQWAGSTYAWADWRIVLLFVLGAALGAAFVASQICFPDTATISPRIAGQRTVLASAWFQTMAGGTVMVVTYWLPTWFQAAQGISALMFSSVVASVGGGMLSTLPVDASTAQWIGYQVIVGLGLGFGAQQASLAVQAVLKKEDFPSAISLIFFSMQLGGSIFVCVGQNVFNQQLTGLLTKANIASLDDPSQVLDTGATEIWDLVTGDEDLATLLRVYNEALTSTFYVAAGTAAVGMIGALFVQWKSGKDDARPSH
ncbi:hypothetical protein MKZ38_007512 [Zalerion maritima]|uniref:Major facilitator superfamily (MFS) profile domain-containing protein n=1 Tax=Zalerion maritima TaxID=339359 RepID=A0AAD5RID7_9PEZI|nr:hypothetical protein MKZ38_007512 [Zalerion maritima]